MTQQPPPTFAIINEVDGPYRKTVVQWVEDIGYCYLNRELKRYDGMPPGSDDRLGKSTSMTEFGFNIDLTYPGVVLFEKVRESTATYKDGKNRKWADRCTKFGYELIQNVREIVI